MMSSTRCAVMLFAVLMTMSCQSSRDVSTAMPAVGQPAPDFRLVSNDGEPASLSEMLGKWIVLYFYPKDFSGGCTLEAQNFQRDLDRYERLGAVIVGISVDSASTHKEFCAREGLTFKLLADVDGSVSASYGSLRPNRTSARNTFLIDAEGKIVEVFTAVNPTSHSTDVLAALERQRSR